MSDELQGLLEKIRNEGVKKAEAEAEAILAEARSKAAAIVADAKAKADASVEAAKRQAETFTAASQRTIKQTADNVLLGVEKAVLERLEKILVKNVTEAAHDVKLVSALAAEAVRGYLKEGDVKLAAAADLAEALRAEFSAQALNGVEVVLDPTTGGGFRVLLSGGRIEHTFTGAAVAEALAKQLRPSLAALLK